MPNINGDGVKAGLNGRKCQRSAPKHPLDAFNCGMEEGFGAALRGESNRYPTVTNIIFCGSRSDAETGMVRIRAHPNYHDSEKWSIDDAPYSEKPGFAVNHNWDMVDSTRVKSFRVAYGE